ncbi:MAG TPA: YdhR family protein [Anaerolineales bacterium]|nr:YdhR family protein [Anaerolineales bacterium]
MSEKILQLNLNFSISRVELEAAWLEVAQPIAEVPGLRWKVWLMNDAEQEAGGIYLFESETAAQSYLAGPIVAALKSSPAVSNISAKLFDVLGSHSAITRGPVKSALDIAE